LLVVNKAKQISSCDVIGNYFIYDVIYLFDVVAVLYLHQL